VWRERNGILEEETYLDFCSSKDRDFRFFLIIIIIISDVFFSDFTKAKTEALAAEAEAEADDGGEKIELD
jgi:hypothetical protein